MNKIIGTIPEDTMLLFRRVFLEWPEGREALAILLKDLGYVPTVELPYSEAAMTKINIARRILAYCGCVSDDDSVPGFVDALARAPISVVSENRARREAAGYKRQERLRGLQRENEKRR